MRRLILWLLVCGSLVVPAATGQRMLQRTWLSPTAGIKSPVSVQQASTHQVTVAIDKAIFDAAALYGVDPALIAAIIQVESSFNPYVISPKGAMGLMQLMPATARSLGVWSPLNPVQNIHGGTKYVRCLIDQFRGNLYLVLAAYNAGPGAVQKYGWVPPYRETRAYIPRVLRYYRHFSDLLRG